MSLFERRHFEEISELVADIIISEDGLKDTTRDLITDRLAESNHNFNAERFGVAVDHHVWRLREEAR